MSISGTGTDAVLSSPNASVFNSTSSMHNATAITSSESPWLVMRLLDSFSLAVLHQSKDTGSNSNLNDNATMFLSYWMSPFSMMCMITAVVMNRIVIFASARRNRRLPYLSNLLLRSFAIYMLFLGSYGLFVSLKCYSKNNLIQSLLKSDYFTFNKDDYLNKTFLSIPLGTEIYQHFDSVSSELIQGPTTSVLKSFHLSLCISQILHTFVAVASGSKPSIETGITLFEYSLAFQEVQFSSKPSLELLTIALIALTNQLVLHLLGIFDLLKYRLIPSTIIGLFTLSFYAHNLFTGNVTEIPFIIILGYFPHFCVLLLVLLSNSIFILSGIVRCSFKDLTMLSLLENLNSINVSLSDDFYSALINFGEFIINISISQCYIQETSNINLPLDNYINLQLSELKEKSINKIKKINGYGNEYKNNPELLKMEDEIRNNKKKSSWLFLNKLKMMNRIIFKFLKLLKVKLASILLTKTNSGNSNQHVDRSMKKFRIIKNEDGSFQYETDRAISSTNIDTLTEEQIENMYPQLLLNTNILEEDNSPDYLIDGEFGVKNENEEVERDDDDYDEIEEINPNNFNEHGESSLINELITSQELMQLLIPSNATDAESNQILSYHMQHLNESASRLTRSHFAKYYIDDIKLLDLLREKNQITDLEKIVNDYDSDLDDNLHVSHSSDNHDLGLCVICHENSRQIILWPCKCLAICESCRVSLFVREFSTCVCCRHKVEGYSKVYLP